MKKNKKTNMSCKLISFVCVFFLFSFVTDAFSASLSRRIKGNVRDALDIPLVGVSVVEKGTTNGCITDMDGNFVLDVKNETATIIFSFIGYETQEFSIPQNSTINVVLKEDIKVLDELVVVSYGTQKKRDMTGAIASVKAEELGDLPVGQVAQKLQGQIPGVQINQSTGIPGQGMAFRIRGAVSITQSSAPLIVVDGFPISTGLNNINPDEIESFSVLKDAAATSLYGSRAGNGVILITTKKGKKGKINVQANVSYGIQTTSGMKEMNIMNAREFAQFKKEWYEDAIRDGDRHPELGVPERYQNPEKYGKGTDWYKLLTRTASIQNYSLNLSGGSEKLSTAITIGYFRQNGVVKNSMFERFNIRSNNSFQVNDKIKIGLNVAPVIQNFENKGTDGNRAILSGAIIADPTQDPYDDNGDLKVSLISPDMFPQVNWLRAINEGQNKTRTITVLANSFLDIDIWTGLKYRFQVGADLGYQRWRNWVPSTAQGSWISAPPGDATANYNTNNYYTWNIENIISYDKNYRNHNIGVMVGFSAQKFKAEYQNLHGKGFPDDDISWITEATAQRQGATSMTDWTLSSFFARLDYNYLERYLLQLNFRRDGSSRFGRGNKYANFPSISSGWIVSDEAFMKPLRSHLNYLKFRVSYGVTGNYNIGDYSYLANVSGNSSYAFNGIRVPGKSLGRIGNQELTWEENNQFDIGVDFGLFNDRIFVMYDFYSKRTKSLLNNLEIPWTSGFSSIVDNIGEIKSWGHEFSLESRNLVGDFQWKTNFNITIPRNKVKKLSFSNAPIGGYNQLEDWNRLEVGKPIGIFMGWIYDGVYMTQKEFDDSPKHKDSVVGGVKFKDLNGDGVIDMNDRTKIGNPNPNLLFGITNEFKWNNFDLSFLFAGQLGGDLYAGAYENTLNLDGVFNVLKKVKDRWRSEENPGKGKIPRTKAGSTELYRSNHSGWVYDGSYLTLKNLTIGYTIPIGSSINNYLKNIRLYFSAQQLFTLTKYPGLNPEISNNNDLGWRGLGIDRTTYPIPRTFSFGCNLTF